MNVALNEIVAPETAGYLSGARTVGIDIGSRAAKGVLLYDGTLYYTIQVSGVSSKGTAKSLLETLTKEAGISENDVDFLVGTGYGRVAIDVTDIPSNVVTEISCHSLGGHYLNPKTKTIIDIGGQDSKVIKVDEATGQVIDFVMNDKCAAGTGRFLEKVAQLLDLTLEEFGEYATRSEKPLDISSQCVVFAESEVISLKAKGYSKEDIAAGVHLATARRIKNLLRRIGIVPTVLFTGGVSNNKGMVKALEDTLGISIGTTALDTTFAGALGAAAYGYEYHKVALKERA